MTESWLGSSVRVLWAMATDRWIRRVWYYVWPILLVVTTVAFLAWIFGCTFRVHLMEKHSHYSAEPPASVTAEKRIMGAFGIDDDSTTDNQ